MFLKIATRLVQDIEYFGAIGAIVRFGGRAPLNRRVLVKPPKHFCRLDFVVVFVGGLDERVCLLPEADFGRVAKIPPVPYDTMFARGQAR